MRTISQKLSARGMLILAACAGFVAAHPASAQSTKRYGPVSMGSGQSTVVVPAVAAGNRFVATHIYVTGASGNSASPLLSATCDAELTSIDNDLPGSPPVRRIAFYIPLLSYDGALGGDIPLTYPLEAAE